MNIITELIELLKKDDRLIAEQKLSKNKVVELAYKLDPSLVKLLLSNSKVKSLFFVEVDGIYIFNQAKFQAFVTNKQFLPDSYTSYKNKIGLIEESDKDVVLSFPYKDCILEGGQDKEDAKRQEVFYNKTLAIEEIDRLFEPKVFTNAKRFSEEGEQELGAKLR